MDTSTRWSVSGITPLLYSSLPDTDIWSRLPAPRDLFGALWVQGTDLFAQSSLAHGKDVGGDLLVSLDGGQSWVHDPVPSPGLGCQFDQVRAPVLWETCSTGMSASVWISHDNGATFTRHASEGQDEFSNAVTFAAATNTVGIAGLQQLYRTTNGARTFTTVDRHRLTWSYIGFTDAQHGAAIAAPGESGDGPGQLWVTRDAGVHWHRVHALR
jgi:photosystem II stability/assembly factor-like uncharacterized protein